MHTLSVLSCSPGCDLARTDGRWPSRRPTVPSAPEQVERFTAEMKAAREAQERRLAEMAKEAESDPNAIKKRHEEEVGRGRG